MAKSDSVVAAKEAKKRRVGGTWFPHAGCRILDGMSDVTRILSQIEQGDPSAGAQLLPLVYAELRKLAAHKLTKEPAQQTLEATALVHEAYLRLVNVDQSQRWNSRGHFFAAAGEAMRRILVENARRKSRQKRGGEFKRRGLNEDAVAASPNPDEIFQVHEALESLEAKNPDAANLVKLRYFAGYTIREAAEMLGISPRKANQLWTYARAFLMAEIEGL